MAKKIKYKKKSQSAVATVILSVFLSLLIVGAGGYFGLPYIFPNLTTDLSQYEDNIEVMDEGILLQSKVVESWDWGYIVDSSTTEYELIPDMNISIDISTGSKIHATFSTHSILEIYDSMDGRLSFVLNLSIVGITKKLGMVYHYSDSPTGIYTRYSNYIYLDVFTDELPAGKYEIRVDWISIEDRPGDNMLIMSMPGSHNNTRSLVVQELK